MPNNYFQFKQFTIQQGGAAMKVGTDGVLLGAWADVTNAHNILDIGAGTGLISIMLAQRTNADCTIDAVEIEEQASKQSINNFSDCPWASRLKLHHTSFQEFVKNTKSRYDVIVSNPPYFINGLDTPDKSRTKARSAEHLPFEELISGAKNLLNDKGRLSVILPIEEGDLFIDLAQTAKFYLHKQIQVLPNPGKPPKRYLLEFSKIKGTLSKGKLVVENGQRHEYTLEYIALTKDFYLNFK